MNQTKKFLSILLGTIVSFLLIAYSVNAQATLNEQSTVSINGIGSVKVGMTVSEASEAAGIRLVQVVSGGEEGGCFYFKPQQPEEVYFMVINNRIARVDIQNQRIATISGARIGSTESQIKSLYPGQIQVTPHEYVQGGHYLTFVPQDSTDKNYRLVFETDGSSVTSFRSGKLPEVEYIEGCV